MKKLKLSMLCMSILVATGCNSINNVENTEHTKLKFSNDVNVSTQSDFDKLAERIIKNDVKGNSYLDKALSYVKHSWKMAHGRMWFTMMTQTTIGHRLNTLIV